MKENSRLKKEINMLKANLARYKILHTCHLGQMRHFRLRLLKIRNSIDYLLKHPFSNDNNLIGRKHMRDIHSAPIPKNKR